MSRCLIPAAIKALPARSRIGTADYCAYPVASVEADDLALPDSLPPGVSL
ncbi:hypothetical protein [Halomonas sp. 328]|nr:hypothetical protein [Halomonas sp. 328]MBF8222775.1 hypothetical protein [Halomonas sp. 328]